jgi:antitoxin MazE
MFDDRRQERDNYKVSTFGVGMEAKIIAIGNSKGLRLPKEVLKRCNLAEGQAVSIGVQGSDIMIRPKTSVRGGWDAAFAKAGASRVRENLWGELPVGESWDR